MSPVLSAGFLAPRGVYERGTEKPSNLRCTTRLFEGYAKQLLTTGKVAVASIMGDSATLPAMRSNEEDTVTAYDRASRHEVATAEALPIFQRALADELRHREWMSSTAANG